MKKSQNWVEVQPSVQSPLQNITFDNTGRMPSQ